MQEIAEQWQVQELVCDGESLNSLRIMKSRTHNIGYAAAELLDQIECSEGKFQIKGPFPFVQAFQEQLGFDPADSLKSDEVILRVTALGGLRCSPLIAMHLWCMPRGSPVGVVHMEPISVGGDPCLLEVGEDAGIRWLRALSANPHRRWRHEKAIIFAPQ